MKIHIIIIFFSVILGASCEKSESQRVNYGSILLESIHFSVGGETIPLSRAVGCMSAGSDPTEWCFVRRSGLCSWNRLF